MPALNTPRSRTLEAIERAAPLSRAIRRLISAAPDFALGATFLGVWLFPRAFDVSTVRYLTLTMLLEFIVIHSSAIMGGLAYSDLSRVKRIAGIVGLGVFYSAFVAAFAVAFSAWWPFWAFWGLTLNRLSSAILGTAAGEDRSVVTAGWVLSVATYLLGGLATTLLPIPRLGLSADLISSFAVPGGGLWVEEPHRMLAFGALYFLTQGVSELWKS